ncbi:MAG: DUF1501 domain-containing protein [bacterium]|nr:DUF1501 domain-containing protein [bacterium]
MAVTRRDFLRDGTLGLAASACVPMWLSRPAAAGKIAEPLLVVLFLRGAADALHLVPPVGDPDYTRQRGQLSIENPLPFAPGFALHPALAPLQPLVDAKQLAVVHAVGSSDTSRSHFEAQDLMEMASGNTRSLARGVPLGWLARALRRDDPSDLFSSLALSLRPPLSLRGAEAFAMPRPESFGIGGASRIAQRALEAAYVRAGDDPVGLAGTRAFAAVERVRAAFIHSRARAPGTRPGSRQFVRLVEGLGALERARLGVRAVFFELDGWDTHANQGGDTGQMARAIGNLASGLARLFELMQGRRDVIAVVMTEFGRTVAPNGSGGTDHGHGSAMLVAGPRVRGGIFGDWPGLAKSRLYEGRDLAITSDYRNVLHEVLSAHLGEKPPADTFPGFSASPLGLLA